MTVHGLELLAFDEAAQEAELAIHCSTGTYIRSLARDLGAALGTGAHCAALRRTAVGAFAVDDAATGAVALERPHAAPHWRRPAEALPHLPALALDPSCADALVHGRRPAAPPSAPPGPLRAVDAEGRLVAVVRADEGRLVPDLVLEGAV